MTTARGLRRLRATILTNIGAARTDYGDHVHVTPKWVGKGVACRTYTREYSRIGLARLNRAVDVFVDRSARQQKELTTSKNILNEAIDHMSEHEATVRRQNTTTTLKEYNMPALHNRQLALKLAVENLSEDALYVDGETVDQATLDSVIQVADQFAAYLGSDEATLTADTSDAAGTTEPAAPAEPEFYSVLESIVEENRDQWGGIAADFILSEGRALQGQPFNEGVTNALSFLESDRNLASGLRTALVAALQAKQSVVAPAEAAPAPAATTASTGAAIITLLQSYRSRYGSVVDPLIARAEALRSTPLVNAKRQAVDALSVSTEIRTYPTQVRALIADIQAL